MKQNHRPFFSILVLTSILLISSCSVKRNSFKPDSQLFQSVDKHLADAAEQYKVMMKNLGPDRFPRNYDPKSDKFETSDSEWWCSGFYPGSLLYLYEQTKDKQLYTEAERILKVLEKEKNNTSTHDLGFMMFCSFGNANRIAPKPEYKDILVTSANSLITRFNPKVGCIKSWDSKKQDFLVIIDNMMNLELLFWATKVTGDSTYYKIAVTHANTTLKNHFRPDNSSYHVINYDSETGNVKQKRTAQGYADESAWARGQAWGLYGYVLMYRETKDKKYLDQAQKIAEFTLNHSNLLKDKIPYWDFNAPNIPDAPRDASAGAINASALLELSTYVDLETRNKYFAAAETMISTLSSAEYKATPGTNGGFILKHSVGHLPQKSEVDVAISYADYYYVEALIRYKNLSKTNFASLNR